MPEGNHKTEYEKGSGIFGSEITFHNKDIFSKSKGDRFKNKSFSVYGLKLPQIVDVRPTNLPEIEANELRMDHLFYLADGSVMIVDYESCYMNKSKLKYLSYVVRVLRRCFRKKKKNPKLRMLVIYTADVARGSTQPQLDVGCMQFRVEEAFLSDLDSSGIESEIRRKVEGCIPLNEEDQMRLMILPLTHRGNAAKRECIRRCFDLIKRIEDEEMQTFLLSNMLVFTDKVIDNEDSNEMRKWLMMTKVERIIYEEKMQAVREAWKEAKRDTCNAIAAALLKNGVSAELILKSVDSLTREDLEKMQAVG